MCDATGRKKLATASTVLAAALVIVAAMSGLGEARKSLTRLY